jgi:hypothetical protein
VRVRAQAATALSEWSRTRGQEFVRAAQDAACGVTVRVHVRGLPGIGTTSAGEATPGTQPAGGAGTTVTVVPGKGQP